MSAERMNVLKKGTLAISSAGKGISIRLIMASSPKNVWNDDFLLNQRELRSLSIARTITFVEIDSLARSDFDKIIDRYPKDQKEIRKRVGWLAVFRMVQYLVSHENLYPEEYNVKHSINTPVKLMRSLPSLDKTTDAIPLVPGQSLVANLPALDSRMQRLESSNQQILVALTKMSRQMSTQKEAALDVEL